MSDRTLGDITRFADGFAPGKESRSDKDLSWGLGDMGELNELATTGFLVICDV